MPCSLSFSSPKQSGHPWEFCRHNNGHKKRESGRNIHNNGNEQNTHGVTSSSTLRHLSLFCKCNCNLLERTHRRTTPTNDKPHTVHESSRSTDALVSAPCLRSTRRVRALWASDLTTKLHRFSSSHLLLLAGGCTGTKVFCTIFDARNRPSWTRGRIRLWFCVLEKLDTAIARCK